MSMNTNHANSAVTETAIASPAQNGPQLSLSLLKGEGRGEGSPLSRRNFFRLKVPAVALFFAKHKSLAATESKTRHRFLCCDYQGNQVAIVAPDGAIEWRCEAQTPQDCWMLPNGNVLFCYTHGAKEVSPDK